jgi:Domain of unknown function (DUF4440)
MRRTIWLVVTVVGVLATPAAAGNASTPDDRELLKAREAVWHAWFTNDQKLLHELVPVDTIAINSGEKDWEYQPEILQSAADFQAQGGKLIRLEFPRTEIRRYGDVAILYSHYIYETEVQGKHSVKRGRATEVFVQHNGKWTNPGWQTDSVQTRATE